MSSPDEALGRLERVLADYPHRVAELRSRVAAAVAAEVSGEDLEGLVRVGATGNGEITSVRVTERALRELDAVSLAERIVEAVNAALAAGEAALADAAQTPREPEDTGYAMARFAERMDDLLDRLVRIDRDLEDRLGE